MYVWEPTFYFSQSLYTVVVWISWCTGDLVQLGDFTALLFNHPKEVRSTVSILQTWEIRLRNCDVHCYISIHLSICLWMYVVEVDANNVSAHCHTISGYFLLSELWSRRFSAVSISLVKKVGWYDKNIMTNKLQTSHFCKFVNSLTLGPMALTTSSYVQFLWLKAWL